MVSMSNTRKHIILLDVDGVLCDFVGGATRLCAEVGHKLVVDCHDFTDKLQRDHRDVWRHYMKRSAERGFCYNLSAYHNILGFVEALQELGDVVAVTSPLSHSPHWHYERLKWLTMWAGIQRQNVIFAKHKDLVVGDFLVEDNFANLEAWHRRWRGAHNDGYSSRALLVGHDYNAEHQPNEDGDWFERHELVDGYDSIVESIRSAIANHIEPITGRDFH